MGGAPLVHRQMASLSSNSLYLLAAAAGGAIAVPFILLRLFRLPAFPSERVKAFIERGHCGVIAHRGGRPENTLAAIRRSKEEGASGVEVDLKFTKDGHAVLLHDRDVARTSNGRGAIDELSFEEARKLDFGIKYGAEFAGERIPTLYEAVDLCEELDLQVFLDVKTDPKKTVNVVTKLFAERPHLYDRVALISFWPGTLYKIRSADPNIVCGLIVTSNMLVLYPDFSLRNKGRWRRWLAHPVDLLHFWCVDTWLWRLLGVRLLLPYKNDILTNRVKPGKWVENGVSIVTWTVNKMEEKKYFQEVLCLPFMTDSCSPERVAPEQTFQTQA